MNFNLLPCNDENYQSSVSSNLPNVRIERPEVGVKFCGNSLPQLTIIII